jgi:outer membrane lipoprotein-sorting protein
LSAAVLTGLCGLSAVCQSTETKLTPEVDALIAKATAAYDPHGKLDAYETQIIEGTIRRKGDPESKLTMKFKKPGMMRIDVTIPGKETIIRGCDGKTAWVYSSRTGYRALVGEELGDMLFQSHFLSPNVRFREIFDSIVEKGKVEVAGNPCIELECVPKEMYQSSPLSIYIDEKTLAIVKMVEWKQIGTEKIPVDTYFSDYKDFDGIMMPTSMVTEVNGVLLDCTFDEIEWNQPVDSGDFEPPVNLIESGAKGAK